VCPPKKVEKKRPMKPIEQSWVACDTGAVASVEPGSAALMDGVGVDQAELIVDDQYGEGSEDMDSATDVDETCEAKVIDVVDGVDSKKGSPCIIELA
jgi:hypothetical protein